MKKHLLVMLTLFWAVCSSAQTPLSMNGRLKVSGKSLVNECNTAIQLRGLSTHGIMFQQDCYTESSIKSIAQDWKADIIRLAVYTNNSNGATKGYAQTADQAFYHQWIDNMVTLTEKAGIYVIIDWHILSDGNPATNQTLAKSFFTLMSQKYKNKKHVLYEICNEPNGGTTWDQIKTYAADIIPAIRANDPNAVILVGTPEWSSRIDQARANPLPSNLSANVMYSLHFYAGTGSHDAYKTYLTDAMAANFPVFVSEWGMTDASGAGNINASNTASWLALLAQNKVSWCNWQFSDKAETSSLLKPGSCISQSWTNFRTDGGGSGQIIYDELRKAKNYTACGSVTLPAIVPPVVCPGATGSNLNIYGCPITNSFNTNYCEGYNNKQAYVKTDFSKDSVPYFTFWKKPSEGSTVYSSVVSNGKLVITSVNADPNYSTMGFNFGNLNATTLLPIDMRANAKLVFDVSFTKTNYAPADVALFIELIDAAGNTVNASALGAYNRFIIPADGSTKTITADFTNGVKRVPNTTGTTGSPQEDTFTRGVFDFSKVTKITVWVNPGVTGIYARVPFTGTWTVDNFSFGYDAATAVSCDPYTTVDLCPNDPNKTAPGKCGCGVPETNCDCAGVQGGSAYTDLCGKCVGGTTGKTECAGNGFGSAPYPIPGQIEAENFDKGGQGSGYNDATTANEAGANYRPGEGVDIELVTGSTTNYDIGYTVVGEWLNYTVNVLATGTYNVSFKVASAATTGKWHLELNGVKIPNSDMSCPNTGGWQTFQTIKTTTPISLTQGKQVIRVVIDGQDVNIDYMLFESVSVVNPPPTVSLTAPAANSTSCAGTSITLTASATDNGSISKVEFFDGTTLLSTVTAAPYTYVWNTAANGTHSLTARATDNGNAATTSTAVSITVSTAPAATITAGGATTFCTGGSVTLTASAGASYKWFNGTTQVGTAATYGATTAGSYIVEVTSANNCKATSAATTVTVNTLPTATITAGGATTLCAGGSVTLTASAGASYKWFNGTTQVGTAATYAATTSGSYTVEVTNAGNCKATSAATAVTVNAAPTATIATGGATTFCAGGSVTLTASAGASYTWFNGTTQVGTASTFTASTTGSYTVEVTNATNCKATSAATTVTVNAAPVATITAGGATTFCAGGSVILTASSGASYKWFNGTTQVGTASTFTAATAGSYTVEVTNANNCKATSAATVVTMNSVPTASITTSGPVALCTGGSVTLTASTGSSYIWKNGTTVLANTAQTLVVNTAGNYTVEVTYSAGCKATSPATTVSVNALPTATITAGGTTTFCVGGNVTLTSSAGSSYKWFNGTTQIGTVSTFTASTTGSYTVEVTNANNCKATSAATTVTVTAAPNPPTVVSPIMYCQNTAGTPMLANGTALKWYTTSTGGAGSSTAPVPVTTSAGSTDHFVSQTINGCESARATITVNVAAPTTWYSDSDGDGKGDPNISQSACSQPINYVAVAGDLCPTDANKTTAGNCGCNKTEASCQDCAGVPNGTAALDICSICSGGTTGRTPVTNQANCTTTGTMDPNSADYIKIIPNPSHDRFSVALATPSDVQIMTAEGKLIDTFSGVTNLNFGSEYAKGIYFVQISNGNHSQVIRVIKQ